MNYVIHLLVTICLYAALAQSLNILVGYAGLLSLCHAAFFGLGAYASALLMIDAGLPFPLALLFAVLLNSIVGWLVAIPSVRLRGDFFVLATIAFQMITFSILYNWVSLTRGPYGISGIPRPSILGTSFTSPVGFLILTLLLTCICCAIVWWLVASPYGRTLQAVRDDETAAASLGKDVESIRRSAFAWSGGLAALPGALFAAYSSYIDPTSFGIAESVMIFAVLVIGGSGSLRGPIVGSVTLVLFPELLRLVYLPDSVAANVKQIAYGIAIVIIMRLRPQGIAGKYAFD